MALRKTGAVASVVSRHQTAKNGQLIFIAFCILLSGFGFVRMFALPSNLLNKIPTFQQMEEAFVMRIISRQVNEGISIGDDIQVTILEIMEDAVRLGFTSPNAEPSYWEETVYVETAEALQVQ